MTPDAASTVIVTFGQRKRWLSKPSDYAALLRCARQVFDGLAELEDNEIIVSFTPDWIDEELELDDSTFEHVHDKARLRIDTCKNQQPSNALKRKVETGAHQNVFQTWTSSKRSKMEEPTPGTADIIDFTTSEFPSAETFLDAQGVQGQTWSTQENYDPVQIESKVSPRLNGNTNLTSPRCPVTSTGECSSRKDLQMHQGPHAAQFGTNDKTLSSGRAESEGNSIFHGSNDNDETSDAQADLSMEPSHPNGEQADISRSEAKLQTPTPSQNESLLDLPDNQNNSTSVTKLTTDSLVVDVNPTLCDTPPRRQCDGRVHHIGSFNPKDSQLSLRIHTEHHITQFIMGGPVVHLKTLLTKLDKIIGYPEPTSPQMRNQGGNCIKIIKSIGFWDPDIKNNSDIYLFHEHRPGLYLNPASSKAATVKVVLKLSKELRLNTLYPLARVRPSENGDQAEWRIVFHKLLSPVSFSNDELYYGHPSWEVVPNLALKSPDEGPPIGFPPDLALTPENSVVVHSPDVRMYVREVFNRQLEIHQNNPKLADISWHFQKLFNKISQGMGRRSYDIAIRFVPRETVDKLIRLTIIPEPKVIGRVFMLYGCVNIGSTSDCPVWGGQGHSYADALAAKHWGHVVKLGKRNVAEKASWRAFDWSMMEVPREFLAAGRAGDASPIRQ